MSDQATGFLSPWLRERRRKAAMPLLERGRILDYGCGIGSLAGHLSSARYLGVDSDVGSIALARNNYPQHRFMTVGEFRASRLEKFDVVVGLALIEHLEQPAKWLLEMRELLTQEGRIILTTPHPSGRSLHELGARLRLFSSEAAEEHTILADFDLMERIAAQSLLGVIDSRRFLFGFNQLFVLAPT